MIGVWCVALVACLGEAPDPPPLLTPTGRLAEVTGAITEPALAEVSGLAPARRGAHLWAVEDSENDAFLSAIDLEGRVVARVEVVGAANVDWEDLSAFSWEAAPHLLIADVGDNDGARPFVELHAVAEPALADQVATVAWTTRFTWEHGPRDCEAVAVDGDEVVLITKRDHPPEVYVVPLRGEGAVARRVGEVHHVPEPTPRDLLARFGAFRDQPTALDLDGSTAALLTYKDAYLFPRRASWRETFAAAPRWQDLPQLAQAEALALVGGDVIVTTEQLPAPLVRAPRGEDAEGGSRTPTP